MVRVFLIRHGESMLNTGENYEKKLPDHKVYLTENGINQANESGKFLKDYIEKENISLENATLFVSPYERTRQTARELNKYLNITDIKEDIALVEHQYGLFENVEEEKWGELFDKEFALYDNYNGKDGRFYVKFPQGESPFDVAMRVRMFISTLFRDIEEGKDTFFIVAHGTSIRAFLLDWFHYSPEWFASEANMTNCSIRLIEKEGKKNIDKDYIYGGRKVYKNKK